MPITRGQASQTKTDQPLTRRAGPASQQAESFISTSTASLPPRYTITLALPPKEFPPNISEIERQYVRGEEILSDGWRRKDDIDGRSEDLQEERRKRRRLIRPVTAGEIPDAPCVGQTKDLSLPKEKPLWYTAGLQYPCTCETLYMEILTAQLNFLGQLPFLPRAYTPSRSAPQADQLFPLPVLGQTAQIPQIGDKLILWSDPHATSDLDPALDELEAFESLWRSADGYGWEKVLSPTPAGYHGKEAGESLETLTVLQEKVSRRRQNKGKERAIDVTASMTSRLPPVRRGHKLPFIVGPPAATSSPQLHLAAWEAESKRRKQAWRERLSTDAVYSRMWSVIPRPHQLESSFVLQKSKRSCPDRPPEYILPRFFLYPTSPHPYHPSLPAFISAHPSARLHWLIPIHGPVLISSLSHSTTTKTDSPIPSSSTLSPRIPEIDDRTRPAQLIWTPSLLSHFWTSFLLPLHADLSQPFGAISIRLSGPKPDPFLALRPPPPLVSHQQPFEVGPGGLVPERPECGDHIRFYCDAKWCLSVRTWLNGVEVDLKEVEGEDVGKKRAKGMFRPFEKVRLCLVGERGEVLTVA